MTPEAAALEYSRLNALAVVTEWGSDEWKAAIGFAHEFENNATEQDFDAYLNAIEEQHDMANAATIEANTIAPPKGYTKAYLAECDGATFPILVSPNDELDGVLKAWDVEGEEMVTLNGWLWTFSEEE